MRDDSLRLFDVKSLGDLLYEEVNCLSAQVCVIIPLYNYANYIAECLDSVLNQDMRSLSLIVIDDASVDGGGDIAKNVLSKYRDRFAVARVVRHRRNQGLSMARNSGIVWSCEPFLFMLDADNRIRPPALSRLLEALLSSQAKFAYSQLWMFGSKNEIGIADIWDSERIALGNYIDAMALIRRQALLSAGGYGVLADDHGWEDFDLWCRFAELGHRGVYLPELLCEYRVHGSSMLRTRTDLHAHSLMMEMALRHPALFSRSI